MEASSNVDTLMRTRRQCIWLEKWTAPLLSLNGGPNCLHGTANTE